MTSREPFDRWRRIWDHTTWLERAPQTPCRDMTVWTLSRYLNCETNRALENLAKEKEKFSVYVTLTHWEPSHYPGSVTFLALPSLLHGGHLGLDPSACDLKPHVLDYFPQRVPSWPKFSRPGKGSAKCGCLSSSLLCIKSEDGSVLSWLLFTLSLDTLLTESVIFASHILAHEWFQQPGVTRRPAAYSKIAGNWAESWEDFALWA